MHKIHGRTPAPGSSTTRALILSIKQSADRDSRRSLADLAEARDGVLDMVNTELKGSDIVFMERN
jgi:hypothetical protein